jgi:hypothetical protein
MLWLVCASTVASAHGGPSDKPNFIIMLADDMGWGDVSCFIHSLRAELAKERVTACAHFFFFSLLCVGGTDRPLVEGVVGAQRRSLQQCMATTSFDS